MLGRSPNQTQTDLFKSLLIHLLDPQHPLFCAASDLVHFRHRIGEKGIAKLFALSVDLYADKVKKAKEVIVGTAVQEKNITFSTDAKRYKKVIEQCNRIAKSNGIKLRLGR